MKKYSYLLQETDWKGENFVSGNTKNCARTVLSTWKKRDADLKLEIGKNLVLIRTDGCTGCYQNSDRITKEKMIEILMKMSDFR